MRTIKVRDLSFSRRFLDCEINFIIFDIYETTADDENMVVSVSRVCWVMPRIVDDFCEDCSHENL